MDNQNLALGSLGNFGRIKLSFFAAASPLGIGGSLTGALAAVPLGFGPLNGSDIDLAGRGCIPLGLTPFGACDIKIGGLDREPLWADPYEAGCVDLSTDPFGARPLNGNDIALDGLDADSGFRPLAGWGIEVGGLDSEPLVPGPLNGRELDLGDLGRVPLGPGPFTGRDIDLPGLATDPLWKTDTTPLLAVVGAVLVADLDDRQGGGGVDGGGRGDATSATSKSSLVSLSVSGIIFSLSGENLGFLPL